MLCVGADDCPLVTPCPPLPTRQSLQVAVDFLQYACAAVAVWRFEKE